MARVENLSTSRSRSVGLAASSAGWWPSRELEGAAELGSETLEFAASGVGRDEVPLAGLVGAGGSSFNR